MFDKFILQVFLQLSLLFGTAAAVTPPDTSRIVALHGRFSMAHGCPVSANMLLTNGHVTDPWPFDNGAPMLDYAGSNVDVEFWLDAYSTRLSTDVAVMTPEKGKSFPTWYAIAKQAPKPGDAIFWVGYDWRKKSFMTERLFAGKVLRVSANQIVFDRGTPSGSSGSCVLNQAGEVVALVAWGKDTEDGAAEFGGGPLLTAPWFDLAAEQAKLDQALIKRDGPPVAESPEQMLQLLFGPAR